MDHISLRPEYIFYVAGISITNSFFTTVIISILLSIIAIFYSRSTNIKNDILLRGFEVIVKQIIASIDQITKDRKLTKKVLPLIATFFLFIIMSNLLALLPGFLGAFYVFDRGVRLPLLRSPNSDLTTTLALACISIFFSQVFSIQINGWKVHIKRYINPQSPLTLFIGAMELISEGARILSFAFRLFGNIFAGEILLLVTAFIIPYIVPIPFMLLEIFVGIIQAYIFSLLTLSFIKLYIKQT
ncbi:F0F1 ATP synthase subunit A [soil metagenome]